MSTNIYQQRITWLAILIFIVGSLFYGYEYIVQVAPSAMTGALMHDFSVNATQLGLLSSCFYWSYTIMQVPAGVMLDRLGARLMLTSATLLCAAGTLLFCVAPTLSLAMLGRILVGISGAFAFTGVIYLIIRWFPPRFLAMFIGILQMMASVGAITGGAVLTHLLVHHPWRHVMAALVVIGVVMTAIIWLVVRNKPKTGNIKLVKTPSITKGLMSIGKNPQTWLIALYSFAIWGPVLAFAALWGIPFLATNFHIDHSQAATAIAMVWIGIALGGPPLGWLSDKIKRRCLPLTIVALIGLVAAIIAIYDHTISLPLLYFLLFLFGVAASGQTLTFALVKDNNHISTTGAANGFNNMAVVLSGVILQPLIGAVLDLTWHNDMFHGAKIYSIHSYHLAMAVIPFCFLISALTSIFLLKESYCKPIYKQPK